MTLISDVGVNRLISVDVPINLKGGLVTLRLNYHEIRSTGIKYSPDIGTIVVGLRVDRFSLTNTA